jgi:hypothetical protein
MDRRRFGIVIAYQISDGIGMTFIAPSGVRLHCRGGDEFSFHP